MWIMFEKAKQALKVKRIEKENDKVREILFG